MVTARRPCARDSADVSDLAEGKTRPAPPSVRPRGSGVRDAHTDNVRPCTSTQRLSLKDGTCAHCHEKAVTVTQMHTRKMTFGITACRQYFVINSKILYFILQLVFPAYLPKYPPTFWYFITIK